MDLDCKVPSVATQEALQRLGESLDGVAYCCTDSNQGRFLIWERPLCLVELRGLEPLTPCLQSRCSSS
jgi:hypothetical protein